MNEKIKINGINNFIKLKNKNFCLNILTFDINNFNNFVCEANDENIDINLYLMNNLKKIEIKYNFFLPYFQVLDENKKYNYHDEIIKIQNNESILRNITFINYNYNLTEYNNLINFVKKYESTLYFNRGTIELFIYDLTQLIIELNLIVQRKIPKKIKKDIKIALEYIYINYFKNKINIIIYDCNEIIKYCEININKLKETIYNSQEYYETIKYIYKSKGMLCININYILNFINTFDILINLYNSQIKDNILYLPSNISNLLIYLLVNNLNFEIVKIDYSDKIIDNNNLSSTNKIIKNMDILNESSLSFLQKYLTNDKNCITINKNDFL
jgi:hypothetical protein